MTSTLSPSSQVVDAVARYKGVEATDLPPLYETIEPDALDALFPSRTNGTRDDGVRLEFTYAGRDIVVRGPRDVEVRGPDSD